MSDKGSGQFVYADHYPTCSNEYTWPFIRKILGEQYHGKKRIFEIGCGNGATAAMLKNMGYKVVAVDNSDTGIALAKRNYQDIQFCVDTLYDDLAAKHGKYPVVISLEVIEHCISPRKYIKTFCDLMEDGGLGILSTPYHGYVKNLAMAITGKTDHHFTALWEGGHIKFFSKKTMRLLLESVGMKNIKFYLIGRIAPLARSMLVTFTK